MSQGAGGGLFATEGKKGGKVMLKKSFYVVPHFACSWDHVPRSDSPGLSGRKRRLFTAAVKIVNC